MKKQLFLTLTIAMAVLLFVFAGTSKAEIDINNQSLYNSLKGKIILRVEVNGEAYYVHPEKQKMYYLGRPSDAFQVMREQGVGIKNENLEKIHPDVGAADQKDSDGDFLSDLIEDALGTDKYKKDTDNDGHDDRQEILLGYNPLGSGKLRLDNNFANEQVGKIFLQVENKGEAWYVNPDDLKRYFLGRPTDAFYLMRDLGIGISEDNYKKLLSDYGARQKEEALNFSLKIVKSYFDNDCENYYNSLEKKLFIIGENRIVNLEETDGVKEMLCKSISEEFKGDFNYQDYLDSYNYKIMEKSEYNSEIISLNHRKNIDFSSFSSNDYLFVGYQLKEGKKSLDILDDFFLFMVRVKDNEWTISGPTG